MLGPALKLCIIPFTWDRNLKLKEESLKSVVNVGRQMKDSKFNEVMTGRCLFSYLEQQLMSKVPIMYI